MVARELLSGCSLVAVVVLSAPGAEAQASRRWLLPGAVRSDGQSGARFRTTLLLTNAGNSAATVRVAFLPPAGSVAPAPAARTLSPGQSLRQEDALHGLFGLEEGAGTLDVEAPVPVLASTTTQNVADPRGTYGLAVPPVAFPDLLREGETGHAAWVSQSADPASGYRTNVSVTLVEAGTAADVVVLDGSGVERGRRRVEGGPATWQESLPAIAGPSSLPAGRVELRVLSGRAAGYAVVNDNVTSDAIAAPFERLPVGPVDLLVDGVARSPGQEGTYWRTDLRLFNPGGSPLEVTIEPFVPGASPPALSRSVPSGAVVELLDILGPGGFSLPEGSAGAVRLRAPGPLLAVARTSNVDPAGRRPGTFSASQRAARWPSGLAVAPGTYAFAGLDHVAGSAGFRTNVAFLAGAAGASATLVLRDASGAERGRGTLELAPHAWEQRGLPGWVGGPEVPPGARLDVAVERGGLDGYASRIDNGTGDPVILPLRLLEGAPPAVIPAFPGAEGFGALASGGRGGRVIYVTTLAPDGPGSLQEALDQEGPRYVLFKVSGLIDAPVHLTRSDVTIAGQTSPGGVTVRQLHTTEEPFCDQDPGCILRETTRHADNWIVRNLRMRPAGAADDGLRIRSTRRAVVDRCSIANAEDEAVEISLSNDVTIQRTVLAETVGSHANLGGMLLNYSHPRAGFELDRISIHHDVFARLLGRLPELSRESPDAGGTTLRLELSNNVLLDPGFPIDVNATTVSGSAEGDPVHYALNWTGNLALVRPGHPFGMLSLPVPPATETATFFDGNRMSLHPARRDYQLVYCCDDYQATLADPSLLPFPDPARPPSFARGDRHPFPPVTVTGTDGLAALLHATAGAFPRDPMDRRLLAPLLTGTFDPAPRDQNPYGDALVPAFPEGQPPAPPVDTDGDGMPDEWERAHGLDPSVAAPNGTSLSVLLTGVAGYTDLECYLNELADSIAGASPR